MDDNRFVKVSYEELNSRQKENFNFQKASAVLAEYGYNCLRLSDDWQGADFIAVHIDGETFRKIQLKGRLSFDKKYQGKDIWVVFRYDNDWYIYPHDEILDQVLKTGKLKGTDSWEKEGAFSFGYLSKENKTMLEKYKL
ncbi:MAG: hypothetical protein FWD51_05850 [Betaproteobacteria bacterium]|nr:hypothetical protein [Betaproteobacteria bacterium]